MLYTPCLCTGQTSPHCSLLGVHSCPRLCHHPVPSGSALLLALHAKAPSPWTGATYYFFYFIFFSSSRQIHRKRELAGVFSWLLVIFSPWGLPSSEGFGCRGVWQPTRQQLGQSHCAPRAAAPSALNAEGRGLPQSASLGCCSFQYALALCVCCPLNPVPVRHSTARAQGESETTRCRAQLCHSVPF